MNHEEDAKHYIGFQSFEFEGRRVIPSTELTRKLTDSKMYMIADIDRNIIFRSPPPDTRSRFRKFYEEWKRRFSHAWYALKGGECD